MFAVDQIEQVPIDRIRPYARNVKQHPPAQIDELARIIREFGFLVPVLLTRQGELVAGEGRYLAAKKLGMANVPALFADHLSERQIQAFRIAENRIAQKGAWDFENLAAELDELANAGLDLSLTAMDEQELDALLRVDADILPADFKAGLPPSNSVPDVPAYQPNLAPDAAPVGNTITVDMEAERRKLEDKFNSVRPKLTVMCPHCGESFEIDQ